MLVCAILQSKRKQQQQTNAQQEQQAITAANSDVDDADAATTTAKISVNSELDHAIGTDVSDYNIGEYCYIDIVNLIFTCYSKL
jgi:hypothetical protein